MSFWPLINKSRLSWLNMISCLYLSFSFFIFPICLLSFRLVLLSILPLTKLFLKLSLPRYALFFLFLMQSWLFISSILISRISPATTNGHTDNEQEVKVIMLVSENNILLGLLSHNFSLVYFCVISFIIFIIILSASRVLCR